MTQELLAELREIEEHYYKLIMAVETKYPGETRYETALRYIKDGEYSVSPRAVENTVYVESLKNIRGT